jgi:hypothetical protein
MRNFADLQRELGMKKFLASRNGTLYFVPGALGDRAIIARHFDRDLPVTLVAPSADLTRAAQRWIDRHPEVARLARVAQPTEVGHDFIVRPHFVYTTATRAYEEDEDPPPPPAELDELRRAFSAARAQSDDPRDAIVETVLARSLLEPTGKTFQADDGRFTVVELKPTAEELQRWAGLAVP